MTDDARVPVTQISRDAAASVSRCRASVKRQVRAGDHDHLPTVQAFAAHHLAGVAAGREEADSAIRNRVSIYMTKRERHDYLADDSLNDYEKVTHTLEALGALFSDLAAIRQRGE